MTANITPFNPSTAPSGEIALNLANGGWFYVVNETIIAVTFRFGDGSQRTIPPLHEAMYRLTPDKSRMCDYTTPYNLENVGAGSVTGSTVFGEVYAPGEWSGGEFIASISSRLANVGNNVPLGQAASSVQNDGNAAPTQVVEGTPSGATSSQLKWNNDGSGTFGGGAVVVNNAGVFTSIPASALPASAVATGYPAADLGAGALPASVTIAGYLPLAGGTMTGKIDGSSIVGAPVIQGALHGTKGNGPINGVNNTSGTGSGTFSHALGATPDCVQVTCTLANSSQTQGVDTWTSTTIHITSGAGYAWNAWLVYMHYN